MKIFKSINSKCNPKDPHDTYGALSPEATKILKDAKDINTIMKTSGVDENNI